MTEVIRILQEISTSFLVLVGLGGVVFAFIFLALLSILEKIRDELKKLADK